VALVMYKTRKSRYNDAFTPIAFSQEISNHVAKFHRHLFPRYLQEIERPQDDLHYLRSLDWTGADFTVGDGPYDIEKSLPSHCPSLNPRVRKRQKRV
jgi:hypothetical protein